MISLKNYILLCLSSLIILACTNNTEDYFFHVKQTHQNFIDSNYKKAYEEADKAIKIKTDNPIGYTLRGRALFEMDRNLDARKDFRNAVHLDSLNTTSLYYMGLISYDLNEYTMAIEYFNKAISTKGSDTLYFELNDKLSEYTYEENISMASLKYFRGICYYYNNDFINALTDLTFAANENYNKGRCFFYIGLMALTNRKEDLACKYLTLSIQNGYLEAGKYLPESCR